jgi:cobalt-zinc-cadmium efflux system outer membrane protein
MSLRAPLIIVFVALVLTGCTSVPIDLGRSDIDALTAERGQAATKKSAASLIESLTAEPLTAEGAIRLALVNNPALTAHYASLGFAAADVYQAGRIRNPVFSAAILDPSRSGEQDQLTFGLMSSFTDLITLPARKRLAEAEFAAMKQEIGAAVLKTAAEAQQGYYHYVAAKQTAALRQKTAKAAGLSLALATRYHDAGNLTPRDFALAQGSAAEAQLDALTADAQSYLARTELAGILGVSVGGSWDSPTQLPLPLTNEDPLDELLVLAAQSRLDLAASKARVDITADRLGVTNWTRFLGDIGIGFEHERETDGARLRGPTFDWEIPIFSQNRDALMRVDAELQIAIADYAGLATQVQNDVHLAYAITQNAKARVDAYRELLVPARIAATNRAQEEENFMLIGIFELIETKQNEYDSYQGYLETVRDYWLARTALTRAVGNTLPSSTDVGDKRLDVESLLNDQSTSEQSKHGAMTHGAGHSDTAKKPATNPHQRHDMNDLNGD